MTRLLFPEAYGVMSLVWAMLYGLQMFSDVGLAAAIIRDKRGDDPRFLNTAWTLSVCRGVLLSVLACLIAYPMSLYYHEPQLSRLLPVAGLTAIMAGFQSTAMFTCRRQIDLKRLTLLELATEIVMFIVLVTWAYLSPTVWALVGGAVVAQLFLTLATHAYLPGPRNRFQWERSSLLTLMNFGKWIFLSSAVYFLSTQGDRMLLGHYLDMAHLGVYGIAVLLSDAVQSLVLKINSGVLFPAFGRVVLNEPDRLRSFVSRTRLAIDVALVLPTAILMMLGGHVVALLYDVRYHEAGWMFRILCIRLLMVCTLSNSENCLVSLGHPQYSVMHNVLRAIWILGGIPLGWSRYGIEGVVWAVALSEIPVVVVIWAGMARHRMLSLKSELRSLVFVGTGALVGIGLLNLLH